eukprot:5150877-Alexandrium_andersonii.AAC.1
MQASHHSHEGGPRAPELSFTTNGPRASIVKQPRIDEHGHDLLPMNQGGARMGEDTPRKRRNGVPSR